MQSYDCLPLPLQGVIDSGVSKVRNQSFSTLTIPVHSWDNISLLRQFVLITLITLHNHYTFTSFMYKDSDSEYPLSFVDIHTIGYHVGKACFAYYIHNDPNAPKDSIEPPSSDIITMGTILIKSLLPERFYDVAVYFHDDSCKSYNILTFNHDK
jgi:hypothetical protein